MPTVAAPSLATTVAMVMPNPAPTVPAGPRPAFTILRESTPAAAREYASLPLVRPWRELARAVDPIGRLPLDAGAVWAGDVEGALALPAHFDGRRRWGRLLTSLRDQGLSGACWAFAVVSALGDRAALWTHGAVRAWPDGIARPGVFSGLAPRDIIDCDFDALTDAQIEGEADIVSANEIHHGHRHADYGHTLAGAAEVLYVAAWRARAVGAAGRWPTMRWPQTRKWTSRPRSLRGVPWRRPLPFMRISCIQSAIRPVGSGACIGTIPQRARAPLAATLW